MGLPTPQQSQVALNAATADIDNDPTDDQIIPPPPKPNNQCNNGEKTLFVHCTHEKRFTSMKRDMHKVYDDIFANTPASDAKIIVGHRNRRDTSNELIRKRPKKTLLRNEMTQSKSCSTTKKPISIALKTFISPLLGQTKKKTKRLQQTRPTSHETN